ncbi:GDP-mannose 4,6-dehydratase [Cellulomonas denverensis]|uniref:GDP-mannose 4,6-dehydratase n=1 Tax=Cellulomonas denverensis TaxID=264297 RepID=A0A7X6KUV6_9CELL|nr:GDP-mannose 4,6-dehydratase [Cellulomonas denverensis]NKY22515.1 GDP-mannose 4,6-dehydratase [Cellulomonas denverensis]GIG25989.1 GDP-mannose 4,6-dehydratase [Cellulomonas denverensis]
MTVALITGVTGQDGSYLAERLVAEGVTVHGLVRPGDEATVPAGVHAHAGDLADRDALRRLVLDLAPTELYHLAGISSVAVSWQEPELTALLSGVAVTSLLEAAWQVQQAHGDTVRFVQASSAEIFGDAPTAPQDESAPIAPVNPYGAAKAYAHHMVAIYRARGLHASAGILFNHESPRRPPTFVTRKITQRAAQIAREGDGMLTLGNLEARRDWGWAPDYVDALIRLARHDEPIDAVVATGVTHTVRDFALSALRRAGVADPESRLATDPAFVRPADAGLMVGDATRARTLLGWAPTRDFDAVVAAMVDHDLELLG